MKLLVLFSIFSFSVTGNVQAQAEVALNKGGCGSKIIRARYATKSQIAGSMGDGKIIAANNLLLSSTEVSIFSFSMEAGVQYDLRLIIDPSERNKLNPHPQTWGRILLDGSILKTLNLQRGTDISYEFPVVPNSHKVEIMMSGSNYYDLRDEKTPEDVCAILYVVKRKTTSITSTVIPPVVKTIIEEPTTIVPAKKPENKKILFNNWEEAKNKYSWQWLETPKTDNTYRYFLEKSLMVVQKKSTHAWTQTILSYKPFPAYWEYSATFNAVNSSADGETGLMMPATKDGEAVKAMFYINPFDQTYFFGYYNTVSKKWFTIHKVPENKKHPFSSFITKYDAAKKFASNRLTIRREGNTVFLLINSHLVETITVAAKSALNKLNGVGITGSGLQGYYVDQVSFWVLE